MRVVVTRPQHSGERTVRRLTEMGHEALSLPLSEPVHDVEAARQALSETQDAIAVTSAEAIRALAALGQNIAPHLGRPLFAVGKATAKEARDLGFTNVLASEGSGIELAELIARSQAGMRQPLLYLAGSPRAAGFETRSMELKMPLRTVECYHMLDIVPDDAALRKFFVDIRADAVLLYSRQTALRFFSLPFLLKHPYALAPTRFLCLSEAIADAVPALLRAHADIAAMPDEDSLLALLTTE
ncbi:uroporphyrinogen-III synthase [Rhizobium sp. ICMP 5592]|uniref:uroporphyrinogen-III synthase n=1 Tax=Rhizobium sp. ICMP 5592 TaxID=2292445 RepID=UPI00129745AD|nr:uroporphyrinogen-III synthase [Rhizobium sp. ICMP 5592]MQB45329.1 uroporphyrinogen-III synthase [Rhizobium sp. ICMP 5592]